MNKVCKRGFTIIEWLISFFITLIILTIVFQFSAQIYSRLICKSKFNTMFTETYVALDTMSKHISQAPDEKNKWKYLSSSQLMWHDQNSQTILGYRYEKQKLFFLKGKRKNLIANNLEKLKFTVVVENEKIKSVQCSVAFLCNKKRYTLDRVIRLKNGRVS